MDKIIFNKVILFEGLFTSFKLFQSHIMHKMIQKIH
jgi:hypothetical protein